MRPASLNGFVFVVFTREALLCRRNFSRNCSVPAAGDSGARSPRGRQEGGRRQRPPGRRPQKVVTPAFGLLPRSCSHHSRKRPLEFGEGKRSLPFCAAPRLALTCESAARSPR